VKFCKNVVKIRKEFIRTCALELLRFPESVVASAGTWRPILSP
jgi:hypothetical protein